jgi:hypothetical protein
VETELLELVEVLIEPAGVDRSLALRSLRAPTVSGFSAHRSSVVNMINPSEQAEWGAGLLSLIHPREGQAIDGQLLLS